MKHIFFVITAFILYGNVLYAQQDAVYTSQDEAIFDKYEKYIKKYRSKPMETVLEKTAEFFLGSPYVANTLEVTDEERLIANLHEFDCVTYIETVIALSEAAKSNDLSFETYLGQLRNIRYRDDEVGDYSTRLHYTSDWVYDNEKDGLLRNISRKLDGEREKKKIDFMSSHRKSYKQLKSDNDMLKKIESVEKNMNKRDGFYYVPKAKINDVASKIPHMAMIGFTTAVDGLDTSHTGFAYRKNGKLTFIHASSAQKKVVIDKKTLSDYCAAQKSCTGVIVAEIND